jgi:hypothetical protein
MSLIKNILSDERLAWVSVANHSQPPDTNDSKEEDKESSDKGALGNAARSRNGSNKVVPG